MRLCILSLVCAAILLFPGCDLLENEQDIPLEDVPQIVIDAAKEAVPGITLEEAEVETDLSGNKTYELEGNADGVTYEIEVSADGKVIEVEEEDEDDDE